MFRGFRRSDTAAAFGSLLIEFVGALAKLVGNVLELDYSKADTVEREFSVFFWRVLVHGHLAMVSCESIRE